MDCKTANQLIRPYIDQELDLETVDSFLRHIRNCKECREEFEIYFTVQVAIDNLNRDKFHTYDLKGQFEEEVRLMQEYIRHRHFMRAIKNFLLMFTAIGIVISCMLQFRIWF